MKLLNWFRTWEKLENKDLPKWITTAYGKWNNKFRRRPYNTVKYFYGKTFVYKIECRGDVQGGSYHFYRKLRN